MKKEVIIKVELELVKRGIITKERFFDRWTGDKEAENLIKKLIQ